MFERTVTITKIGMPSDIYRSSKYAKIRKQALTAVGLAWFNGVLPKHFKSENKHEYTEIKKRKAKYLKYRSQKAKRKGKDDAPLTLTGQLKRMVTRRADIRTYGKKVTIKMQVPFYATGASKSNYIVQELRQNSKADKRRIVLAFKDEYTKLMKEEKHKVVERIK